MKKTLSSIAVSLALVSLSGMAQAQEPGVTSREGVVYIELTEDYSSSNVATTGLVAPDAEIIGTGSALEAPAPSAPVIASQESAPVTADIGQSDELPGISAKNYARMGAVADSVTTYIALQGGGVEQNGLVNTSVGGLVALAAVKLGLLELADYLPKNERAMALKLSSAVWAGVSINNLLVGASVAGAAPVVAGLAVGYWMYNVTANRLALEDAAKAANEANEAKATQIPIPAL